MKNIIRLRSSRYWSFIPFSLSFYCGSEASMDYYYRAVGRSVRCVQITDEVAEL